MRVLSLLRNSGAVGLGLFGYAAVLYNRAGTSLEAAALFGVDAATKGHSASYAVPGDDSSLGHS